MAESPNTLCLANVSILRKMGGRYIREFLESDKPVMIGRIGSVEIQAINAVLNKENGLIRKIPKIYCDTLCNNAGFFPNDINLMNKFAQVYQEAAKVLNVAAVFGSHDEDYFYYAFSPNPKYIVLRSLEAYYLKDPWTKCLEGKKVLIVSPFAKTIEKQYKKRELLFKNPDILPAFDLKTLKAIQTIGSNTAGYATWFDALNHMKTEISKIDFDIVLLGCGAYAFPLAAYAKSLGKKAVIIGGATQILFGIKGKRWDNHPIISKLYNEFWTRPDVDEIPKDSEKVENGCYW